MSIAIVCLSIEGEKAKGGNNTAFSSVPRAWHRVKGPYMFVERLYKQPVTTSLSHQLPLSTEGRFHQRHRDRCRPPLRSHPPWGRQWPHLRGEKQPRVRRATRNNIRAGSLLSAIMSESLPKFLGYWLFEHHNRHMISQRKKIVGKKL